MDIDRIVSVCEKNLNGKEDVIRLALCNFLAQGHTLIEDMPGVGKTTLAKSMASAFSLLFKRTQFTNDLLPADILGHEMYNPKEASFSFKKGPIFTDIFLADELNRAPARTQSALLQAMEESKIVVNDYAFELSPFFHVIATQNPLGQIGTFDLPESQLDRFSMKLSIGYVGEQDSMNFLKQKSQLIPELIADTHSGPGPLTVAAQEIEKAWEAINQVKLDDSVYRYIYRLLNSSRKDSHFVPLSNRCGIDLVKVAKTWAWMKKESYVIPEYIIELFPYVAGHRLSNNDQKNVEQEHQLATKLLEGVSVRP